MARVSLFEHRKFKRLALSLGGRAIALGSLELIWHGCYQTADDYLGDEVDVEAAADWRGESGKLAAALLAAGFIEADPERPGYRVHDLFDHAPQHVKDKLERELARQQAGESLSEARSRAGKAGRAAQLARTSAEQAPDTSGQVPKQVLGTRGQIAAVGRGEARRGFKSNAQQAALGGGFTADIEAVYAKYPRKIGKAKGMAIAAREIKTPADLAALERAVKNYSDECAGREPDKIAHFSTFMGRWRDHVGTDEEQPVEHPECPVDPPGPPRPGSLMAVIDGHIAALGLLPGGKGAA